MRGRVVTLSLVLVAVGGCREADERFGDPAELVGPIPLASHVAYVHRGTHRLLLVEPTSGAVRSVALVEDIRAVTEANAEVMVIGGGGRAPVLERVDATGATRRIELPGAYDRIEASPDGRFAILLYDPRATPAAGAPAARNANELAVVDLTAGSARREVLGTESVAPREVVYSAQGSLAAVLLDSAIAVVDLTGAAPALRIPLELPGGDRLSPTKALFSPDAAFLYVHARASTDVLSIELLRDGTALRASINFLAGPAGAQLSDIAVVGDGPSLVHAVAAAFLHAPSASLLLLDARGDTSLTREVEVRAVGTWLSPLEDGLVLFHANADTPGTTGGYAFAVWDPLAELADESTLGGTTVGPVHVAAGGLLVFEHQTAVEGTNAITVASTSREQGRLRVRASPVVVGGTLTAVAADRTRGEVYLGVTVARRDSGAAPDEADEDRFDRPTGTLVVVRGQSLDITGVPLDHVVERLGLLGGHVFATHPSTTGHLTFLPRDDLRRESARSADALTLAGVLDGEEP